MTTVSGSAADPVRPTATSAQQMRTWTGPGLLSFGFRPFFLFGAVWAALAMVIWLLMMSGELAVPIRFDPVLWHAHEFLFGYLGAIIAGFLLTALPNWTGRLPIVGWRLGFLVLLWALGRVAVLVSQELPAGLVAAVDLAFPVTLGLVLLREIIAGRNWRNLPVLSLLAAFALANGLFHWQTAVGGSAADGTGLRLGVATALMLISVIGGRIVPSFTRNWLVRTGRAARPVAPMQIFDKLVLAATLVGLVLWVVRPEDGATGIALLSVGTLQAVRLARWQGASTASEPLVWVLHAGYAFVPLGALCVGTSIIMPDGINQVAALHVWMAGAIGLMTLAVMTRATLGHTGQDLHAGSGTVLIYVAIIGSVFARLLAEIGADHAMLLYRLSGLFWILAFTGFAALYGPLLVKRRPGSD
ncbi:MAG: NnrS family protein [Pseudomonadota bacterium]